MLILTLQSLVVEGYGPIILHQDSTKTNTRGITLNAEGFGEVGKSQYRWLDHCGFKSIEGLQSCIRPQEAIFLKKIS